MKASAARRRLLWPILASLTVTCALASPAAGSSDRTTPRLSATQRAAAAQLAAEQHVSAQEAQRRILRQDRLTGVATALRTSLASRFGGAWIDQEHGGRLTVAVTRPAAAASVRQQAARAQAPDTATVVVRRSWQQLDRMSDTLARRIAAANKSAPHGLQSAVVVRDNKLRLDLPRGKALTGAQRSVVRWAEHTFGDALTVSTYAHASKPFYCGGQYSCDPPLRSGLAIYGSNIRCTSAFMAYDSYGYYMMTAGHCAEGSSYWQVPTYSYGYQGVGSVADYTFGYYGDSAVVRIDDSNWWQPRGWVYPSTRITGWGYDYVGQYVCKQGSTTGYTCGQITETDATVSYPDRTLAGMTWSTACDAAGDSGSGVYDGSTAHGILSGGPDSGCGMIHEPVSRALSDRGVTLLAG
ncbi:S1 family peptidase [Streptomyces sp. NPDC020996]|uniref:S1 family peptidase n=1 Tax=Streptomyces sp. NPDC020996 TaxID=3154791 RepID=UPI0034091118